MYLKLLLSIILCFTLFSCSFSFNADINKEIQNSLTCNVVFSSEIDGVVRQCVRKVPLGTVIFSDDFPKDLLLDDSGKYEILGYNTNDDSDVDRLEEGSYVNSMVVCSSTVFIQAYVSKLYIEDNNFNIDHEVTSTPLLSFIADKNEINQWEDSSIIITPMCDGKTLSWSDLSNVSVDFRYSGLSIMEEIGVIFSDGVLVIPALSDDLPLIEGNYEIYIEAYYNNKKYSTVNELKVK